MGMITNIAGVIKDITEMVTGVITESTGADYRSGDYIMGMVWE